VGGASGAVLGRRPTKLAYGGCLADNGLGAGRQRDWATAGKNFATMAAAGVAAVTHAPAIPVLVVVDLLTALQRRPYDPEAAAFIERFIDRIANWCRVEGAFAELGDEPSGWRGRLRDRLIAQPVDAEGDIVSLFVDTVFEPTGRDGRERSEVLAERLVAAAPTLIVDAGDRFGVGAAAVALANGSVARIENQIRGLDPDQGRAGDAALFATYLAKLIDRLDRNDLNPPRRGGPRRLTAVHQRLSLTPSGPRAGSKPVPVDELAAGCDRLVILGGPGTGKSWTARQIAIRAAEAALNRLAAGQTPEEIEIPLFAVCSQVLEASDLLRWERLINATLRRAAIDPGQASRLGHLLRSHERVLIVLDGLDEAAAPERDSVHEFVEARPPGTIRVVLTSRPGSWDDRLLDIAQESRLQQIGTLEPFTDRNTRDSISAWLDDLPATRDRLLALVGNRTTALGRQARVPLLCAMYCIAARPDPDSPERDPFDYFAPGQRLNLFDRVIRKLLVGSWRGAITGGLSVENVKAALGWLEDLAVAGDIPDPAGTGLAKWPDAIPTHRDPPSGTGEYVEHVAPPGPHHDDLEQSRQFVHRSLRDHLMAKALCRQAPHSLVDVLIQHLWFDTDWAEVVPAVVAGHPQADALVRELTDRVSEISEIDPTRALQKSLVKAAALTTPDPDPATARNVAINDALLSAVDEEPFAEWGNLFAECNHWPSSSTVSSRIVDLVEQSDATPTTFFVIELMKVLAGLRLPPAQRARVAEHLLDHLNSPDMHVEWLAEALVRLEATPEHRARAAHKLADHLTCFDNNRSFAERLARALARVESSPDHLVAVLVTPGLEPRATVHLITALTKLEPLPGQRARAADHLAARLTTTSELDDSAIRDLAAGWSHLISSPDELIAGLATPGLHPWATVELTRELVRLGPTEVQSVTASDRLITLLTIAELRPSDARGLTAALVWLGRPDRQCADAIDHLVNLLAVPDLGPSYGAGLTEALANLEPSPDQVARAIDHLAIALTSPDHGAWRLAQALVALHPAPDQLVTLFSIGNINPDAAKVLARALLGLRLSPVQCARAADQLVTLLTDPDLDPWSADQLATALVQLEPTPNQRARVTDHLIALLIDPDLKPSSADQLATTLVQLARIARS
jgi:NACHT domain